MPYKKSTPRSRTTRRSSARKLRAADLTVARPATAPIAPAPAPKFNYVPDLDEIIALPQDEMRDIVARFMAARAVDAAGGGRGAGGGARAKYFTDWLAALKTLDFDKLSRNAQVDYLTSDRRELHRRASAWCSRRTRRARPTTSASRGTARGRDGLIHDLQDSMIPYTPEQLIALAKREFAWCEEEMKKASRELGFGDDWKKAVERRRDLRAAGRTAAHDPRPALRGDRLPARERSDHRAAGRGRVAAHDDDVAGAAAHVAVLPRRRRNHRVVSDRHDGLSRRGMQSMRGNNPGSRTRPRSTR